MKQIFIRHSISWIQDLLSLDNEKGEWKMTPSSKGEKTQKKNSIKWHTNGHCSENAGGNFILCRDSICLSWGMENLSSMYVYSHFHASHLAQNALSILSPYLNLPLSGPDPVLTLSQGYSLSTHPSMILETSLHYTSQFLPCILLIMSWSCSVSLPKW